MRYILLAAVCAGVLIATPATARDDSAYIGIEGGLLFPKDFSYDVLVKFPNQTLRPISTLGLKRGYDIDAVAGYDFGIFRTEAELGYKRTKLGRNRGTVQFDEGILKFDYEPGGKVSVFSLMANALLNFGNADGVSFYAGGGAGWARVRLETPDPETATETLKDSGLAWQLIAGAQVAISSNVDLGVKYRYFRANRLHDQFDSLGDAVSIFTSSRFRSHSLLATVAYNFGHPVAEPLAAPPVAAPAPMLAQPPATQTCPDRSVILTTDICPLPPSPPPPPPPAPERG